MSTTETLNETENQLPTKQEKQENGGELGLLSQLVDVNVWNRVAKMAEIYAGSSLVPDHFKNETGNCLIALQLAMRMQVDPFMLMQNMYVVNGRPGLEAKFAIAMCNTKGVFQGRIKFDLSGEGDSRQCMAYAFDQDTGERVEETVTFEIAKKEGWVDKKGSKWKTIPDLMLKYRSAMWLIRTTCPEVLMGMQSTDELNDIAPQVIPPATIVDDRPKSELLADQLAEKHATQLFEAKQAGSAKEETPDEPKLSTLSQIFVADMKAAGNLEALTAIKNRAYAESQIPDGLPMADWVNVNALYGELKKSFAD